MRLAGLAIICAACGGGSGKAPAPAAHAASIVAPPETAGDLEVARVAGRPVWGSCVAAQVARGEAATREAALDQCIAFELMAQEAERRGLATDPGVVDDTRTAMVNRLVEVGFEDRVARPADLGDALTKFLTENAWREHRPELRASTYARVKVDAKAPADTVERARAVADRIEAALAPQTGLFGANVRETATQIIKDSGFELDVSDQAQVPKSLLEAGYGAALFAIPEVGRVSPVVRTPWGWDVILWSGGLPAKEFTPDELAAEKFEDLRRAAMTVWVNDLIKQLGVHIEVDPAQLDRPEGAS